MLITRDLQYSYDREHVLSFPDLELKQGQHGLLIGGSGSGKTTFLHLIAGLLKPQKGEITIAGKELSRITSKKLDQFRGKHIGLIFQVPHLIASLSVLDNLLLAQYLANLEPNKRHALEILDELNLGKKEKAKTSELSQGELQRVAIARSILNEPEIVLADEPTSSLDDQNCEKVVKLLLDVTNKHQATLLIVTHDQRLKEKFEKQTSL